MDVDETDASAHAAHTFTFSEYMDHRFVVKDRVYEVVHDAEAAMLPLHVQARLPHRFRAISTVGDGSCGRHIVFGTPNEQQQLFELNARVKAQDALGLLPDALVQNGAPREASKL